MIKKRSRNERTEKGSFKPKGKNDGDGKTLKGRVEAHSAGFAFFIPEDKTTDDVFIHPRNLNGASSQDTVLVTVSMFKGRLEAKVVKIISRGIKEIAGIYQRINNNQYIIPVSKTFNYNIYIKHENSYEEGDVLLVTVTSYPSEHDRAYGDVVLKLGHINDIGIDNKIVLSKFKLTRKVPEKISNEAKKIQENCTPTIDGTVEDFSNLYTATIDGEDAKDYDDAISIEVKDDCYILYVHIADVSLYVKEDSKLDEYARGRGTSIYFPQFAIPMLPEELSTDLCSLLPKVLRRTVTVKMVVDKNDGAILDKQFYRSIIKSNERLTYNYVNELIDGRAVTADKGLSKFVKDFEDLYNIFEKKKLNSDYISFDFPENKFKFRDDGSVEDVYQVVRGISERAIEFFMISANEAVASYLDVSDLTSIYRVHDKPDNAKVIEWLELAKSLGVDINHVNDNSVKSISIYSILATNSKYSSLLLPKLVRSMMRAEYSTDNIGHFGLNSEAYTHFTSPIRRYPDLVVHRLLLEKIEMLQSKPNSSYTSKYDEDYLDSVARRSTELERVAFEIETEISSFKKIEYLYEHFEDDYLATINTINSHGFKLFIERISLPAMLDFDDINFDEFAADSKRAIGKKSGKTYKIGDEIEINVHSIDIASLTVKFRLKDDVINTKMNKAKKKKKDRK